MRSKTYKSFFSVQEVSRKGRERRDGGHCQRGWHEPKTRFCLAKSRRMGSQVRRSFRLAAQQSVAQKVSEKIIDDLSGIAITAFRVDKS